MDNKDLINEIIEISKMSTKENSILYNFSINDKTIKYIISIVDYNGDKKILKSNKINISEKFYHFITPLLKDFIKNNNIVLNDFVDMNKDNIVTYRLITDNNDQFCIDGLTFEDSAYIRDVVSEINLENDINNEGAVSTIFIVTIIVILVFVIWCITYFL